MHHGSIMLNEIGNAHGDTHVTPDPALAFRVGSTLDSTHYSLLSTVLARGASFLSSNSLYWPYSVLCHCIPKPCALVMAMVSRSLSLSLLRYSGIESRLKHV